VTPEHQFPLDRTDVKKRWKRDDFAVKITRFFGPLALILVACNQFRVFCWHTLSPKSLLRADIAVCRRWRKCDVTMRLYSKAMMLRVCSNLGRSEELSIYRNGPIDYVLSYCCIKIHAKLDILTFFYNCTFTLDI
jgi:hypothetical protein